MSDGELGPDYEVPSDVDAYERLLREERDDSVAADRVDWALVDEQIRRQAEMWKAIRDNPTPWYKAGLRDLRG